MGRCCAIIVTYNGEFWIKKCIDSLLDGSFIPDIMIVDNASTDQTLELLKSYKEVHVIQSKENLGFGKANNIALMTAKELGYSYYFLLNQDAWVEVDTLEKLMQSFELEKDLGIVSPIHLNGDHSGLQSDFKWFLKKQRITSFLTDFTRNQFRRRFYKTKFINAAAWMISKHVLENVGYFHPLFFHYGEDNNYADRVRFAGFKVLIDSSTSICHDQKNEGYNLNKDEEEEKFRRRLLVRMLNPTFTDSNSISAINRYYHILKVGGDLPFRKKKMIHKEVMKLMETEKEVYAKYISELKKETIRFLQRVS